MLSRLLAAYEFLRSDEVLDRVEFIKWASTTQDDSGLLIAVLERLDEIRRQGDLDEVLTRRPDAETVRLQAQQRHADPYRDKGLFAMLRQLLRDFFVDIVVCGCGNPQNIRDFKWGKLDPVRFVRIYKYLKQMENHVYNIHEASCLEQISKPRVLASLFPNQSLSQRDISEIREEQELAASQVDWTILNVLLSFLAIATQIVFIVFIITEVIGQLGEQFDEKDTKLIISNCIITVATITVFIGFVLKNYVAAHRATHVIQALRVRRAEYLGERMRRDFSLLLNLVGNGLLGYLLFWLNIPFILSAETVTDAILNSLATVFLLEIDDRIKPFQPADRFSLEMIDWDNDVSTMNIIKLAHQYLYYKRDFRISDEVEVTKVFKTFEETKDADLRHSFTPQDYCRIYVDDWDDSLKEHCITVFRLHNDQIFPPVYEEIIYKVDGKGAKEFINNVKHFRRVHHDEADSLNQFSRKRALREFGQRRSRSVIASMVEAQKALQMQYLEEMDDDDGLADYEQVSSGIGAIETMSGSSSRGWPKSVAKQEQAPAEEEAKRQEEQEEGEEVHFRDDAPLTSNDDDDGDAVDGSTSVRQYLPKLDRHNSNKDEKEE